MSGLKKAPSTRPSPTNWAICALCQQQSEDPLRDVSKASNQSSQGAYETLAGNLIALDNLGAIPLGINLARLDEGCGIAKTLAERSAKWHKNCYVQCSSSRVNRAESRKRKELSDRDHDSPIKKKLRASFEPPSKEKSIEVRVCFFCDSVVTNDERFHTAETGNIDFHVRKMATEMRDTKLLTKLSVGDMTASDAVYHKKCHTALHTRYRSFVRKNTKSAGDGMQPESIAFAELISYLEEMKCIDGKYTLFKLADLMKLYRERLTKLGGDTTKRPNSTHIKNKLLARLPQLEEHSSNREVVLSFKEDTCDVLLQACKQSSDDDAVILMRAAQIVRKDILEKHFHFNGTLVNEQYKDSPKSLTALMQMILAGTNIQNQTTSTGDVSLSAQSLTQLITFNTLKRGRTETSGIRHNTERETSLPLYLGLLIHTKTRKRDLVDVLFQHGLSVSYDRVMQASTDEANRVIEAFKHDGVVCPTNLRNGLFTTGNLDNIDHNPSATSARSSFHGTAISLTQHVTKNESGSIRHREDITENEKTDEHSKQSKSISELPPTYSDVPPAAFPSNHPIPKKPKGSITPNVSFGMQEKDRQWLSFLNSLHENDQFADEINISWSAYMANLQTEVPRPPAITGLLPMFRESAHTLAMVKHGMNLIKQATDLVNKGQVPVMTVDQPLYALAKKIQWTWPDIYGEQKFVVMMGGLHIEMSFLKVIGDFLDGSGWTSVMSTAGVTTEGRAENLQRGSQTSRSQWAHEVTAAALYALQQQAYRVYRETCEPDNIQTFDIWKQNMASEFPQFFYWNMVLDLECLLFSFIRSQREGNYKLYVESLQAMIPYMFVMDHYHYARWLSVHVSDLQELPSDAMDVHRAFLDGNFVTQKSTRKFSAMAHDQIHEQQNAIVKGDGGVIGITENEAALRRWMVAGPELARIVNEFEEGFHKGKHTDTRHHEQLPSIQKSFASDFNNVMNCFEKLGNPFSEDSHDLYVLDTKVVMSDEVVATLKSVQNKGKDQYEQFVQTRLQDPSISFYDNISKNNISLFKSKSKKSTSKSQAKMSNMKSNVELFSRMYISCQARDGDLDTFFEHECHSWPPSLAEGVDSMRPSTSKADLVPCLEALVPRTEETPKAEVCIFDGAALVHLLNPKKCNNIVKTFGDYAQKQFLPYISRKLNDDGVKRVDVIWDSYKQDSLKESTRRNRGTGTPLHVTEQTSIPQNWGTFLRVDSNKKTLFSFLASALQTIDVPDGKILLTTHDEEVKSKPPSDVSLIQPCTHEEADTRMVLHAWHSYQQGYRSIVIYATDTDVVVITIAIASKMNSGKLWLAFGHGQNFRFIAAHSIAAAIGYERSWGLLLLHAISGCDTVSAIAGIGKKTAWDLWNSMPNLGTDFNRLSNAPGELTNDDMDIIERFFVLLYNRTSCLKKVNEARKHMFAKGNRQLENIPPTREALRQHARRAIYQAGHIWGQSQTANPDLPSPAEWGWRKDDDGWHPLWTVLPEASKGCRELIRCKCRKRCSGNCKCFGANLPCTGLCVCSGQCFRD